MEGFAAPLKSISVAGCALAYVMEKSIMLLARLAAAEDSLARHTGRMADGHVANCGLVTAISIVGTCGSRPNNCHTCLYYM